MQAEFLFQRPPFSSCHASTIVQVDSNTLLVAYFAGSAEGRPDVCIWTSRGTVQPYGVTKWDPPVLTAQHKVPCWNPVLFKTNAAELLLFYKAGPNPQSWSGYLKRSNDGGRNWSPPELLPAGILGPIKNKPIELKDGRLICGSSVESHQAWACWIEITPDGGRHWSKHGPINMPDEPYGIIQPTVFETYDGKLRLMCRATRRIGKICTSTSTDGGYTWSPAHTTELPNPNSGIDAIRLNDGRILLVYNHTSVGRSPLNIALSHDGISFKPLLKLETAPGEYSYPAIIQTANGRVHLTYTWKRKNIKHVSFNPDRLSTQ
jgi:predicted neuraminidase